MSFAKEGGVSVPRERGEVPRMPRPNRVPSTPSCATGTRLWGSKAFKRRWFVVGSEEVGGPTYFILYDVLDVISALPISAAASTFPPPSLTTAG